MISNLRVEEMPGELAELLETVQAMVPEIRRELEPRVLEVIEQAKFRARAMSLARDGLEQMRLELSLARFDLEVTRAERDTFAGRA